MCLVGIGLCLCQQDRQARPGHHGRAGKVRRIACRALAARCLHNDATQQIRCQRRRVRFLILAGCRQRCWKRPLCPLTSKTAFFFVHVWAVLSALVRLPTCVCVCVRIPTSHTHTHTHTLLQLWAESKGFHYHETLAQSGDGIEEMFARLFTSVFAAQKNQGLCCRLEPRPPCVDRSTCAMHGAPIFFSVSVSFFSFSFSRHTPPPSFAILSHCWPLLLTLPCSPLHVCRHYSIFLGPAHSHRLCH